MMRGIDWKNQESILLYLYKKIWILIHKIDTEIKTM